MITTIILLVIILILTELLINSRITLKSKDKMIKAERKLSNSNQTLLTKLLGEKMNELNELKKFFDEPKERISYDDWYKNKYGKDCNYMTTNFPEYWREECDHLYLAWGIRKISVLSPMYLKNLIFTISEFDFKEVLDYMTKTNWYWGEDSKIPTIQEMISNVIELASGNKDGSEKNEGCSSGGFEVIRHMDDTVTIKFSFQYLG